jgi:hypothetical protein
MGPRSIGWKEFSVTAVARSTTLSATQPGVIGQSYFRAGLKPGARMTPISFATRAVLLFSLAIAASACGTPAGGQGEPSPPAALGTELGTDPATWTAHHRSGDPTFQDLSLAGDRVDGFTMHLGAGGLSEDAARATVVKEIPSDARLIFESPKYVGSADLDDQCDLLQYQSTELGRVIPHDPSGVIIVQLGRLTGNGLDRYDRDHITTISILATGTLHYIPSEC